MKVTEDEEKQVLGRRITVDKFDVKRNERTTEIFQYGLITVLHELYSRIETLESKLNDPPRD